MNAPEHDRSRLGAYALGVLDDGETRAVDAHLDICPDCRHELHGLMDMRDALGEVPPEAFLDGPPDADLVLQRALRAVRAESSREIRRRTAVIAASLALLTSATLAGGVLLGRETVSTVEGQGPPVVGAGTPSTQPSGTRTLSARDPGTGVAMAVAIVPAAGWIRLRATVQGVPAGARCQILVRSRDGAAIIAGSWVVSARGEQAGTTLDGSALVAPDDVASVEVQTLEGQRLVVVTG